MLAAACAAPFYCSDEFVPLCPGCSTMLKPDIADVIPSS